LCAICAWRIAAAKIAGIIEIARMPKTILCFIFVLRKAQPRIGKLTWTTGMDNGARAKQRFTNRRNNRQPQMSTA
jgi:hypothetical protein